MSTCSKSILLDQFTHAGLRCRLTANHYQLGGYVELPAGHAWFGREYDALRGGLTYAAAERDVWVVGFDAPHGFAEELWPRVRELAERAQRAAAPAPPAPEAPTEEEDDEDPNEDARRGYYADLLPRGARDGAW
jgi:hypothetical protein